MQQDKTGKEYEEFLGQFVTIERANQRLAVGILKEILPDGKLKVVGDYKSWIVEPSAIIDFSARPDRKGGAI